MATKIGVISQKKLNNMAEKEKTTTSVPSYTEKDIEHLSPIEAIRTRPGMYIRGTGTAGLFQLIDEVISNSIDEAVMGFGKEIDLTLNKNGSITIQDYGRGIPVGMHKSGKPTVELIFTAIHKGAKLGKGSVYYRSGGLHGVALAIVNALSEWIEVEICRDGAKHFQRFEVGAPKAPIIVAKTTIAIDHNGVAILFPAS